ncbi:MAG TPA: threonine ammonia-lyase [Acidimicrobiales bacterium]|nr:threonine ammonia-lyase [Acidimicrobiales bacterium]
MITLADIRSAQERVREVIRPTPVDASNTMTKLAGRPILFKPEHRQRTGSFKIRGAYNLISRLDPGVEVVAASAGNHAQGVAFASARTGHQATIFMPANAALPKVEATRNYGATVRLEGGVVDDCLIAAQDYAAATGAVYVPPFDHPLVIAGQGTVGLEIAESGHDIDVVVVPVGGGGLISGIATALAETGRARVIGVEAAGAPAMRASLDAGRCVRLDRVATMADGIAVRSVSDLTLEHVAARVDDIVTVTEEEISRSILLLLERAKAVVEPAGAVALAAILAGRVPGTGPALAVLSGGNVDPLLLLKLIDHGLSAAGRYLLLRVVLDDRPGALAGLTRAVADMGVNVLEVEHHRAGVHLGVTEVEVLLTVETRDRPHGADVVAGLLDAGFRVRPGQG